jgi:hypothetical protein
MAGIPAAFGELLAAMRRQAAHTVELFSVEARLAALGLAGMISALVMAGVFALTAWGLLVTALVLALTSAGWSMHYTLLALGLIHAIGVYAFWRAALRLSGQLEFRATRRQLRLTEPVDASDHRPSLSEAA